MAKAGASVAGPYRTLLGTAFEALPPSVRAAHLAPLTAAGTMDVVHGSHWLTRLFVSLLNLPAAGAAQPVALRVTKRGDGAGRDEILWSRVIGAKRLRSRQFAQRGLLIEQTGFGSITFALREDDGSLVYEQRSMRLLGVPLWSRLTPRVRARVSPAETRWHVRVIVEWHGHLICRYAGQMCSVREMA